MAKVIGEGSLVRKLKATGRKYSAGLKRGLRKFASRVLKAAKELVPYDTGELEEAGHLEEAKRTAGSVEVDIVFEKPYAVVQHENLEFNHAPGRQAKYLEQPLRELREEGKKIIARECKK